MTGDGISKASGHKNEIYQDIASRLEKVNGWRAATGNTVLGSDNNRQFVFLDEKGERQTKDAEWVAQQIAAAEALKELNGSAKDASKALSEMDHNIKNRTKGVATNEAQETILRSFITDGNFSNAKASNFDYFYKEVS